jgi:hypothetical protein
MTTAIEIHTHLLGLRSEIATLRAQLSEPS